jgi:hypothetical protein
MVLGEPALAGRGTSPVSSLASFAIYGKQLVNKQEKQAK